MLTDVKHWIDLRPGDMVVLVRVEPDSSLVITFQAFVTSIEREHDKSTYAITMLECSRTLEDRQANVRRPKIMTRITTRMFSVFNTMNKLRSGGHNQKYFVYRLS